MFISQHSCWSELQSESVYFLQAMMVHSMSTWEALTASRESHNWITAWEKAMNIWPPFYQKWQAGGKNSVDWGTDWRALDTIRSSEAMTLWSQRLRNCWKTLVIFIFYVFWEMMHELHRDFWFIWNTLFTFNNVKMTMWIRWKAPISVAKWRQAT